MRRGGRVLGAPPDAGGPRVRGLGCLHARSGPSLKPGVPDRPSAQSEPRTLAVGLQERETLKTPRTPPGLEICVPAGPNGRASAACLGRWPEKFYVLLPIRSTLKNLAQEKSPNVENYT